jgi:hypothetical protein
MEKKSAQWVRSPSFRKIFASSYGVTRNEDLYRIDFGDEITRFGPREEDFAFVSEVQIISNKEGMKALRNLLNEMANKGEL